MFINALLAAERGINKGTRILNQIGLIVILGMICLTVATVIARRFLNAPIIGAHEIQQICLMTAAFFTWSYCQTQRGHIVITFIADLIPKKVMTYIEILTMSAAVVMYAVLEWRLIYQSLHLLRQHAIFSELQLVEWPFLLVTSSVGITFFVLALMQTVARHIAEVVKK